MQLQRHEPLIRAAGARLVLVGNGSPSFIGGFRDKTGYSGVIFTDPNRAAYAALQLRDSVRSSLNLRTVRRAISAYRRGFRQTRTEGDPWQQGGVFVIDTDGDVRFAYRSQHAGDHPSIHQILRALEPREGVQEVRR